MSEREADAVNEPRITSGAIATGKFPAIPAVVPERNLGTLRWGMIAFLLSEVAFFCTLIMAYVVFLGQQDTPPSPHEALSLKLVIGTTICLLSSSVTVHFGEKALRHDSRGSFLVLWTATIVLGVAFLAGTAYEWNDLITTHHLTIGRNMFGTTYYTLVGFHALHVSLGVFALLIVLLLVVNRHVSARNAEGAEMVSWYWHFVDAVWIVVFTVVYVTACFQKG
jgi:cytochrome c oxidase subunit 3/cytochrome o ubiquinol oxidase subunit 3